MAGPNEQQLRKALSAEPGAIDQAAQAWRHGAAGLRDIQDALTSAKGAVAEAWTGTGSDAATSAFDSLAGKITSYQTKMESASGALDTAARALRTAQHDYQALPVVPAAPTPPTATAGEIPAADEVRYIRAQGAHNTALNARESDAGAAVSKMDHALDEANLQMNAVAPRPARTDFVPDGGGSSTGGSSGGSAGPTSGSYTGLSGGHVGGYSTSDTGSHVSTGHLVGPAHFGHGGPGDVSVDGTVAGVVSGSTGSVLGSAPVLGGSTSGVATSAVGGVGGLLGGFGGALGVAGGRDGSTVSSATGSLLGGARGASGVVGGLASEAAEGTPLGGVRPGGTSGVLGGGRGTNVVGGSSGGRGLVAGGSEPGTAGTAAGRGGAGATGPGSAGGRTAGGAGGRGLAGSAAEEGVGSRTGTASTTAGGRGGTTGAGGRDDDKDAKRTHMKFEDDWLDEDEMGPGVIA